MSDRDRVTAIVLAGGRSARFGSPKLAALVDGSTVLEHAVRAAAAVAGDVVIAGPPARVERDLRGVTVRFVADDQPFSGPLAALAGALRVTASELAIVVGGDMPALVPAVLDLLLGHVASEAEVVAALLAAPAGATEPGRRQVLPLALRVRAAEAAADAALLAGDRSLARFIDRIPSTVVPPEDWRELDPVGATLLDVDRPDDLERIRGRLR